MATPLILSEELFGSEDDAEISKWLVPDGANINEGQVVAEIETSKVVVEIVAPASGIIRLIAEEGDLVEKNSVIATIE